MRRLILQMRILVRIKYGKVYSYALVKELSSAHFSSFFGKGIKNDVYNTIKSLEKSGYIRVSVKRDGGRLKKYYTITKKGDEAIRSAMKVQKEAAKVLAKIFE